MRAEYVGLITIASHSNCLFFVEGFLRRLHSEARLGQPRLRLPIAFPSVLKLSKVSFRVNGLTMFFVFMLEYHMPWPQQAPGSSCLSLMDIISIATTYRCFIVLQSHYHVANFFRVCTPWNYEP